MPILLLAAGCEMDVVPADPCSCVSVDRVECRFTADVVQNIHEVIVTVDTGQTDINFGALGYAITHTGAPNPLTLTVLYNGNRAEDLSDNGTYDQDGVHITIHNSSESGSLLNLGSLQLRLAANPDDIGNYGVFAMNYDWTFTITGLSGHDVNVSASATDTDSNPVSITCQCICS